MKVSIIVPVYNVEKYIKKCIKSIVNQTLKDIEIIVINDGTKDNSIKIIEKNFKDSRIKIFNKENEGNAVAKNYGVKKATGKYLFFVDADDFIEKNTLKVLYNKAEETHSDIVFCDYYKYYENGKKEYCSLIPFYDDENVKSVVTSMPGPVCKLINRKLYIDNKIEFLAGKCFEDNAIIPYLLSLSKNQTYIKEAYYYYLQREGSMLNQIQFNKNLEDIFESLENLYMKFVENNKLEEYFDELEYIYIEYLLHAANLRFINYKQTYYNINKISKIISKKFPKWRKNKYYKKENIKYKIVCNLFFFKKIKLLKILLKIK